MKKIIFILLFVIQLPYVYSEDQDILKAKETVISAFNYLGNNFIGDELNYMLLDPKYFHDDYIFLPGDQFYCDIISSNINIEDAYYIYDDVNLIDPKEEKILVVTFSYFWFGHIIQANYIDYEYKNYNRIVLNKYYFSSSDDGLKIINTGYQWIYYSFINNAKEWIKNNIIDSDVVLNDLDNNEKDRTIGDYNLYNYDVMKIRTPNDYWKSKSEEYYIKALELENNIIIEAINYLKESVYANPTAQKYFKLAELLFLHEDFIESMHSYNISAEFGCDRKDFAYYNAACAASKAMLEKPGFEYLELALKEGYNYWNHLMQDRDIEYLRNNDKFTDILDLYNNTP